MSINVNKYSFTIDTLPVDHNFQKESVFYSGNFMEKNFIPDAYKPYRTSGGLHEIEIKVMNAPNPRSPEYHRRTN